MPETVLRNRVEIEGLGILSVDMEDDNGLGRSWRVSLRIESDHVSVPLTPWFISRFNLTVTHKADVDVDLAIQGGVLLDACPLQTQGLLIVRTDDRAKNRHRGVASVEPLVAGRVSDS